MVCGKSGVTDKIQVLKETAFGDGGAGGEFIMGVTRRFEWTVDTATVQTYALESSGPQANYNIDGIFSVSGSHEIELTHGKVFEAIMGTLGGTSTNFTLAVANTLPSYAVKVIDSDAGVEDYAIIKGLKYTKFSVALTRDETIVITAEWLAKTIEDTSTFTPTVSTMEPMVYLDGYFQVGGSSVSGIDNVTVEINRNGVARRFIEQTTTGNRRLISCIIDGPLNLTFNGQQIGDRSVLEELWGQTGSVADTRTNKTLNLVMARGSTNVTNLAITGGRYVSATRAMAKDEEVILQDFAGVGLGITGTGTYPSS
jgi:hypothetical protein